MKFVILAVCVCSALSCCGCSLPPPEARVNPVELADATDRALAEIDDFIAELSSPTGQHHAVKVPVQTDGMTEDFWLVDVTYSDGTFQGTINNDPGKISGVTLGDKWECRKYEALDWMYMREGRMHGNYTLRPLLKTMPPGDAAAIRNILANP